MENASEKEFLYLYSSSYIVRVSNLRRLRWTGHGSYGKEVGLGGLGVTCSLRDLRFAVSNPVEVDGFFQDVKILSTSPSGGTLSWGSRV